MGNGEKMKPFNILFITQEDPFYVRLFFEEFFKHYPQPADIKGVVVAPTMGKKTIKTLARQMYNFYGPLDFMKMGCTYAYYKACAVLSRALPLNRFYSIAQVCDHHHIPFLSCGNVNAEEFLGTIRKLDLDLIVSVAAPQIFKEQLIRVPKQGCINIHNSKLPKYRGMMPNFWQMLNGEKAVGITVHRINLGIDDGEILLQKEESIRQGETLDSLIRRTKKLGAHLMSEAIQLVKLDKVRPLPNPSSASSYYSFPSPRDVKEFKRKGYRLL